MSSAIPLIRNVRACLTKKSTKTPLGKDIKKSLLEAINKCLGILELNKTAAKATFLDSRFKTAAFGINSNAENAQK